MKFSFPAELVNSSILDKQFEVVAMVNGVHINFGPLDLQEARLEGDKAIFVATQCALVNQVPEFDEWRELFRDARNRVDCWKEDRVEMLV